jgi:general secretion pathway protein C
MQTRLLTFGVWALVAASALFWALRLLATPTALPTQARLPAQRVALAGDLQRVLGVTAVAKADEPVAAPGADRFHLLGVVWPRGADVSPQGVALIAVGEQPARPWRTGATVDGETVLLAVSQRAVQLGPRGGPAAITLTLPDPNQAHGSGSAAVTSAMPGMRAPNMNLISPARLPQATPDMPPAQPGQIINPGATATREDEN